MIQQKGQQLAAIIGLVLITFGAIAVLSTCEMESQYLAIINQQLEEELGLNPDIFVIYNGNGNTGGLVPEDTTAYKKGAEVTVLGNTNGLSKTGHSFAGWNTSADENGDDYAAGDILTLAQTSATLYARWIKNPTYTVTYHGNGADGGEAPIDGNRYEEAQGVTVKNKGTLTLTGATFIGWNTSVDGSATQHLADSNFLMPATDVDLYAQWTLEPTYTVTYHGNGSDSGDVPMDTNVYLAGHWVNVADPSLLPDPLRRSGHTFTDWNTVAEGGAETRLLVNSVFRISSNVILYAQWSGNDYSVVLDWQGGIGAEESITAVFGTDMPSATKPSRVGYTFGGFYSGTNGSGIQYYTDLMYSARIWDIAEDSTLYAKWTANNYSISFDQQGGNGGSTSVLAVYEAALPAAEAPTRAGYSFAGYYTEVLGEGEAYYSSSMEGLKYWDIAENTILFAHWLSNTIGITINNPANPTFFMVPSTFTLNIGGGNTQQVVEANPGTGIVISSHQWFLNDESRSTENSILLDTEENPEWFNLGVNSLTLVVVINDMPYSESFRFNVEQP
ncbi:MAG: InlB B-repeat-containing protein [Spirochaetes bacterium]|nr:InlB B-repeat-containing protein [Spirochaetota bacterium]